MMNHLTILLTYINRVLEENFNNVNLTYRDNSLAFSKILKEILSISVYFQEVLSKERYTKLEKCKFSIQRIDFLRFEIIVHIISIARFTVNIINSFPRSKMVKNIIIIVELANSHQ